MILSFTLDGKPLSLECAADTRLADILREHLAQTATKLACGIGRCGACSVLINGRLANACLLMAFQLEGVDIMTVEGLPTHPLGQAVREGLAEENAFQCGYCAPGVSLALVALFAEQPDAGEREIRAGLEGNLCRCTGYHSIIRGALNAASRIRTAQLR
jgi:aerobic carbon-monoxide dehydrogenase small subunit